jgi:hypothetical protein
MPPPPVNEIFRLRIIGWIEGSTTVNTLFYRNDKLPGSATVTDLIGLVTAFIAPTGPYNPYLAAVTSEWELRMLVADTPTKPSLMPEEYIPAVLPPGGAAAPGHPNQMAVTIHKHTLWRGKHGRGRISVPAVPRAWTTGTTLTNKTAHQALADALSSPLVLDPDTFTPVVMATMPTPPHTLGHNDIRTCTVGDILGTSRRRKPGVGI